ncbi:MAG: glycoside hydrolase family 5 protein [Bacteroidales bacterium]|nr:glycoside hydrolase family 5 protein [Bacteroidales bacterium]
MKFLINFDGVNEIYTIMNIHLFVTGLLMLCAFASSCQPVKPEPIPDDDPVVENPDEDKEPSVEPPVDVTDWETASDAVAAMGVGWNLGNTLDAWDAGKGREDDWLFWETYWGQARTTPELMRMMKEAGFGAIRIPVTWGIHMDADNKVYDSWMNRVREIVDYVLDAGMYCIVNIHHDTGADDDVWLLAGMEEYEQVREKYAGLWRQIAEEFKDYGPKLLFESYNEMLDSRHSWCFASFNGGYDAAFAADAYKAINSYAQTFVDVVRETGGNNTARNLIVNTYGACCGSGNWNPHLKDPLKEMALPEDICEDHLIFEVHSYPGIDNMDNMRKEVDDMFHNLNTFLASKGAPVILGEWGTSSEHPDRSNLSEFQAYFVRKAMEYGMGTFYWMGLSDGVSRSLPVFSDPESAEAILKAYYGESYEPVLPVIDDYECTYSVNYTSQWGEAHLCSQTISLDEYTAVSLVLEDDPDPGMLAVKIYGEDGSEQYAHFNSAEVTVAFNRSVLGSTSSRITLQFMGNGTYETCIRRACLIRKDGGSVVLTPSRFWGCDVALNAFPS